MSVHLWTDYSMNWDDIDISKTCYWGALRNSLVERASKVGQTIPAELRMDFSETEGYVPTVETMIAIQRYLEYLAPFFANPDIITQPIVHKYPEVIDRSASVGIYLGLAGGVSDNTQMTYQAPTPGGWQTGYNNDTMYRKFNRKLPDPFVGALLFDNYVKEWLRLMYDCINLLKYELWMQPAVDDVIVYYGISVVLTRGKVVGRLGHIGADSWIVDPAGYAWLQAYPSGEGYWPTGDNYQYDSPWRVVNIAEAQALGAEHTFATFTDGDNVDDFIGQCEVAIEKRQTPDETITWPPPGGTINNEPRPVTYTYTWASLTAEKWLKDMQYNAVLSTEISYISPQFVGGYIPEVTSTVAVSIDVAAQPIYQSPPGTPYVQHLPVYTFTGSFGELEVGEVRADWDSFPLVQHLGEGYFGWTTTDEVKTVGDTAGFVFPESYVDKTDLPLEPPVYDLQFIV